MSKNATWQFLGHVTLYILDYLHIDVLMFYKINKETRGGIWFCSHAAKHSHCFTTYRDTTNIIYSNIQFAKFKNLQMYQIIYLNYTKYYRGWYYRYQILKLYYNITHEVPYVTTPIHPHNLFVVARNLPQGLTVWLYKIWHGLIGCILASFVHCCDRYTYVSITCHTLYSSATSPSYHLRRYIVIFVIMIHILDLQYLAY